MAMNDIRRAYYPSKIGLLEITGTDREILSMNFVIKKKPAGFDSIPCA